MNLFGAFIKHERNMDVCYYVRKCFDVGHKVKLKVDVVNLGFVSSYDVNITLNLVIEQENYNQWLECEEPNAKCLRYVKWAPLR